MAYNLMKRIIERGSYDRESTMKGYYYMQFTADERFPRRGGYYYDGGDIGLGYEFCGNPRSSAYWGYGARPRSLA